jgi:hypothetical protein
VADKKKYPEFPLEISLTVKEVIDLMMMAHTPVLAIIRHEKLIIEQVAQAPERMTREQRQQVDALSTLASMLRAGLFTASQGAIDQFEQRAKRIFDNTIAPYINDLRKDVSKEERETAILEMTNRVKKYESDCVKAIKDRFDPLIKEIDELLLEIQAVLPVSG